MKSEKLIRDLLKQYEYDLEMEKHHGTDINNQAMLSNIIETLKWVLEDDIKGRRNILSKTHFNLRGDDIKILNDIKQYIPIEREDIWSWIYYLENSIKEMEYYKTLVCDE